jgi:hypothetical protein
MRCVEFRPRARRVSWRLSLPAAMLVQLDVRRQVRPAAHGWLPAGRHFDDHLIRLMARALVLSGCTGD